MRPNRYIRIGAALIAVAVLLIALSWLIRALRPSRPAPVVADGGGNAVPVAARRTEVATFAAVDIPARSIITEDMLRLGDANVEEGDAIADGDDGIAFVSDPQAQAVGFITQRPIPKNSRLRGSDFIGHISEVGVAGALLPGRRAMVVPIGGKATLHDLIRIGDRIDVMAAFDNQESRAVVQDVRVLAVDVFGKDYPQVKVAMRGDYKASPRSISAANPGSPPPGNAPGQGASGSGPDGSPPNRGGQAAPQTAAPTPAPTPPPSARPEPSLTLEVTPEQATALSLAQASGSNLDYLIRPRSEPVPSGTLVPAEARVASMTRARLAPYAESVKRRGGTTASGTSSSGARAATRAASGEAAPRPSRRRSSSGGGGASDYPMLPMPAPSTPNNSFVPPASVSVDTAPRTYDIPVYGDGKLVRVETVKKPQE